MVSQQFAGIEESTLVEVVVKSTDVVEFTDQGSYGHERFVSER